MTLRAHLTQPCHHQTFLPIPDQAKKTVYTHRNHFRLHLTNQVKKEVTYNIELAQTALNQGARLIVAQNPFTLKNNGSETLHLFITVPKQLLDDRGQFATTVVLKNNIGEHFERELTLLGPSL